MSKKTRKLSKKKIIKFLICVLVIVLIIGLLLFVFLKKDKEDKKTEEKKVEVVDKIEEYNYSLDDNETEYYNKLYNELKEVLNSETLDESKYASLVAKLFLADFFNLDNKITKNDIGGTQFVYEPFRKDFELLSKDGIYKYIESNIYEDRDQTLPVVEIIDVSSVTNTSYTYGDAKDEKAYVVSADITYKENLGYQTSATIYLIHNDKKLEIVEMK